jgi:hypothetical protein
VLLKFGANLDEHQQLLMAASDMLIEIYMAESTILRTEKLAKNQGEDKAGANCNGKIIHQAVDIVTQRKRKLFLCG